MVSMLPPRVRMLGETAATTRTKWAHDRSRHERGYGYAWQKARQRVLARDHGLCQPCQLAGRVSVATEVDHRTPKFEGGTDDDANLQAICAECHRLKTAGEAARSQGRVG